MVPIVSIKAKSSTKISHLFVETEMDEEKYYVIFKPTSTLDKDFHHTVANNSQKIIIFFKNVLSIYYLLT